MLSASALKKKIRNIFNKVEASDNPCYLRRYSRHGGDKLTGRPGVITKVDKLVTPTPAVTTLRQEDMLALSGVFQVQMSDVMMIVSAEAITKTDLSDKDISVVFIGPELSEEEYTIAYYTPQVFDGEVIIYNVLLRSRKG